MPPFFTTFLATFLKPIAALVNLIRGNLLSGEAEIKHFANDSRERADGIPTGCVFFSLPPPLPIKFGQFEDVQIRLLEGHWSTLRVSRRSPSQQGFQSLEGISPKEPSKKSQEISRVNSKEKKKKMYCTTN